MTASLLSESGIHMGARLMAANRGNPRGYYENLDFVDFHESILRAGGDDPAGWHRSFSADPSAAFTRRALELVRANERESYWGWKDPRTTLFLNFWANLLPRARFILLYRAPWEVIDSLFRRADDVFFRTPQLAAEAVLEYYSRMIAFVTAHPDRAFVANAAGVAAEPHKLFTELYGRFGVSAFLPDGFPVYPEELHSEGLETRAALVEHELPELAGAFRHLEGIAAIPGGLRTPNQTTIALGDWLRASAPHRETPRERHAQALGAFLAIGKDALAIDVSREIAADALRKHTRSLVAVDAVDATKLGLPDRSIDVAFLCADAADLEERAALLEDIRRVLRPEGTFVLFHASAGTDSPSRAARRDPRSLLERHFPLVELYVHERVTGSLFRSLDRGREYTLTGFSANGGAIDRGFPAGAAADEPVVAVCSQMRRPASLTSIVIE